MMVSLWWEWHPHRDLHGLSGAWVPGSVVASAPTDAAGSVDLANGHLLQTNIDALTFGEIESHKGDD